MPVCERHGKESLPDHDGDPCWTLRAARHDDLDAIVDLLRACDIAELGRPDTGTQDVLESWQAPHVDMAANTWVAVDEHGRLGGYAELTRRPAAGAVVELDGDFWVRPRLRSGAALGEKLLQRVLQRAAEMAGAAAPARQAAGRPAPAHLAVFCPQGNPAKRRLLERHGFASRRRYLRMAIDLPAGYSAPPPPAGVRIGDFDPAVHADLVRRLMIAAFSDDFRPRAEPPADWRARLLERADFDARLWPVAWEVRAGGSVGASSERLTGAVIAYDLGDIGWVQGLAVAADRRGRGIGLALLRESFARFASRGRHAVGLGVDAGNETGALRLYERAGMHKQQQADLLVRTIRDGTCPSRTRA